MGSLIIQEKALFFSQSLYPLPLRRMLARSGPGGIAHDTSPVSSSDRTADMPVDKQFRFSVGVEQKRSDKVTLGLIFQYADLGDAKIKSYYTGDYDKNEVFYLAFNINWK